MMRKLKKTRSWLSLFLRREKVKSFQIAHESILGFESIR